MDNYSSGAPDPARAIKDFLKFRMQNVTRGTTLGDSIHLANTSATRKTGLLKHNSLDPGQGLWIKPCEGIHTFFMKFAIDVVYIDRKYRVKKAVPAVKPWRLSLCFSAHSVIELPPGTIGKTATVKGDELTVEPVPEPEP